MVTENTPFGKAFWYHVCEVAIPAVFLSIKVVKTVYENICFCIFRTGRCQNLNEQTNKKYNTQNIEKYQAIDHQ